MTLDPLVLLLVLLVTLFIGGLSVFAARGIWQRLLLVGMFSGLWLYSGVGAAHPEVPQYYLLYHFGFLVAFAYAFWIFRAAFARLSILSGKVLTRVLGNVEWHPAWLLVIWAYLLLHLVPLVYPEIRLHHLLAPPSPDLITHWAERWQPQEMDVMQKLVDYARILLTPFFFIALFRYRDRFTLVAAIFAALVYIQYVAGGYIGRSAILIALATIFIAFWVERPKQRRTLAIVAVIVFSIFLVFSYNYAIIRIGGNPSDVTPFQAVMSVLEIEINFPHDSGVPIIESGERVDFGAYVRWILTLPIPKLLTGEIEGARINYEISEIVLGLNRGEKGFYVVLPGLVAESVYIYGRYFFWLHAVFIAFLAAFVMRLMERTPQLLFLKAYVVVTFAFHINRGGISGPMGILINEFMLFYLFVFACIIILLVRLRPATAIGAKTGGCQNER